jgi:MFS family permease
VSRSRSRTNEVKKSLRFSVLDGSANAASSGLTQDYISPFALALKATTVQIGLLSSLPNLATALLQLAAPRLSEEEGGRKRLILRAVFVQALLWAPILLIPYFFPGQKAWWLVALFTLSAVAGSIASTAWWSLMADLVPPGMRGRYFGLRGRICGVVSLVFFIIGGLVLHFSGTDVFVGFAILFGGAMLFRLASWYFLSRMYDPPILTGWWDRHSLPDMVGTLVSSNLGRFILYSSLMNFATYLASPFFAVYMLRDLSFSYLTYAGLTVASSLSTLVFLTFWGRRADRLGNIRVVNATSLLVPLIPLLWLASHRIYYLIPVQILSGCAWSGFTLASTNFVFDASAAEDRTRYIALFNAMSGLGMCLGALIGGFLVSLLPPLLGYSILTVFLISGLLRALVALVLRRHFSEVRAGAGG